MADSKMRNCDSAALAVAEICVLAGSIPSKLISPGGKDSLTENQWFSVLDCLRVAEESLRLANMKLANGNFKRIPQSAWEMLTEEQHRVEGISLY
jgi:hypothetical protein